MQYLLGWPRAQRGRIFGRHSNAGVEKQETNPAWESGAAMTVVITQCDQVWVASLGDCRAVMSSKQGAGKHAVDCIDFNRVH